MNNVDFGFEMQKEIIRLKGLPENVAMEFLENYVALENECNRLREQLIYAIKNNGEYLEIDESLM